MFKADRDGRVALIVGAGGGIGSALASQLLADDTIRQVYATCRHVGRSPALSRLADQFGDKLAIHQLDLTCEQSIADSANAVSNQSGRVDCIINAAGLLHDRHQRAFVMPERRMEDVDPRSLIQNFQVNAVGPLLVVKHFARLLPRHERSLIINLSARVGSITDNRLGGWYGYRSSKAAQNMLTRNLAIELARRHRQLICVAMHPGTVDTALSAPFQANIPSERLFDPQQAAANLLAVAASLTPADNGEFFAWDGQRIPW